MKREHVLTGKVEWYLNVLALHPVGRDVLKILIPKLQEWYGFTEPRELNPRSGIKLTGGEFSLTGDGRNITGVSIDIFHNGFVVLAGLGPGLVCEMPDLGLHAGAAAVSAPQRKQPLVPWRGFLGLPALPPGLVSDHG